MIIRALGGVANEEPESQRSQLICPSSQLKSSRTRLMYALVFRFTAKVIYLHAVFKIITHQSLNTQILNLKMKIMMEILSTNKDVLLHNRSTTIKIRKVTLIPHCH